MKQALLLLHGALGSKAQFNSLKEKLSNQFEIYDLDFEGHGENASFKDFTMDLFVNNVIELLKDKGVEKINIFGYSMGGYVGLNVAKKEPHLVNRIMTLGTKFDWTEETAAKEIRMLNPEKIEEKVPAFANKLAHTHPANNWKEVVSKTAKMMSELGAGKKLSTQDLLQIQQEVLIGIGSEDKMVSIEESTKSANSLPNSRLRILHGFEHPIDNINEDQLVALLLDFFE